MARVTIESLVGDCANRGLTKRQAYSELKPLVQNQTRPMVFSRNVEGHREPKPMAEQLQELEYAIGRIYNKLGRSTTTDFDAPEVEPETVEISVEELKRVEKKAEVRKESEMEKFKRRIRELRDFCNRRKETGEPVDSISTRPAVAAKRLIPAGVPCDALLDSCTMHWAADTRREAGISAFNFAEFSAKVMRDRGLEIGEYHSLFGYVLTLMEARQLTQLIGPFGTGKSTAAKQAAAFLDLPYSETPMSPGATRGDLLGRWTLAKTNDGFITSEFVERYSGGGVFNFEEIDASDPSMLIVLNNAIDSDHLYNSVNGEVYEKHPDFIAVSTANTFGLGANREFTGRERLDAATIDRWRMGRVYVEFDQSIEDAILA